MWASLSIVCICYWPRDSFKTQSRYYLSLISNQMGLFKHSLVSSTFSWSFFWKKAPTQYLVDGMKSYSAFILMAKKKKKDLRMRSWFFIFFSKVSDEDRIQAKDLKINYQDFTSKFIYCLISISLYFFSCMINDFS